MIGKHQGFFLKERIDEITKFYSDANCFVTDIVIAIQYWPKQDIQCLSYFLDLVVLLCSDFNIKLRSLCIDESRAHVDIKKFTAKKVLGDMARVMKKFKKYNTLPLVTPCDYCLLYNVADYIIPIFDTNVRFFDLPHLFETKSISETTFIDSKMAARMQKQEDRATQVLKDFDRKRNIFFAFLLNTSYFNTKKRSIYKLLEKRSGELKIDKIISLIASETKVRSDSTHWHVNVFEEMTCGIILPLIFRNFPINFFHTIGNRGPYLYIKINREYFLDELRSWDFVAKVEKHHSIYHAFVRFKDGGSISIANVIHMKFDIHTVKDIFSNIDKYSHEQHGNYNNYDIQHHEMSI